MFKGLWTYQASALKMLKTGRCMVMTVSWKNCFKICFSVFVLYLCMKYFENAAGLLLMLLNASAPLLIGAVIAYLVNILMSFYEKHYFIRSKSTAAAKSRRPVCMIGAFLSLAVIIMLVISLVVPQLISCGKLIFSELPGAIEMLIDKAAEWNILPENILAALSSVDWKSRLGEIAGILTSGIGNVMDVVVNTVSAVFSGIVTGFLSIIFAIYLLLSKDKLKSQIIRLTQRFVPQQAVNKIKYVFSVFNNCFRKYIVGQCTEAVILGLLCTLGMMLLRLPYAAMIGALIAFTALIPVAGAYIGAAVGAFMLLTVSPVKALIFLVFIVVLQQLEGNLIYPKVVGSSLGLPAIWVLAAVTVGGGMMGVLGMLLGVPITAAVYSIVRQKVNEPVCPEKTV